MIRDTVNQYKDGSLDKASFIREMHDRYHATLFDYAGYLASTNIKKIEIEDNSVVVTTRDRGIRIYCTPVDLRIAPIETLNFSDYEKDELSMVINLVKDGDTFFDVGANVGYFAMSVATARRDCKVYCFEPVPQTFEYLSKNVRANLCSNININNIGLSNKVGFMYFYYCENQSGIASLVDLTRGGVPIECEVTTIDKFWGGSNSSVDFIKCDVEGAELFVFQGGIETIQRFQPIVFSEILRKWSHEFGYNPNEIFGLFSSCGYTAFTVKNTYLVECGSMSERTLETNFFFLHQEKHAQQIRRYSLA